MGLLNSLHAGHGSLSTYNKDEPCKESRSSLIIRGFFEKHYSLRVVLLLFVLMGTSMVIGDGVLTPTMSGDDETLLISSMLHCSYLKLYFTEVVCPRLLRHNYVPETELLLIASSW
jgi:hypothetical protein